MPEPQQGASYSATEPTANQALVDSAIYHGLSLERVSSGMKQKIGGLLADAGEQISGKLQSGKLTDWQTQKAQSFLNWSNKVIANTYDQIDGEIQGDLDGIKKAEIQKQINSVNEAVGVEISPAMSTQQLEAIAKADELLVNGAVMSDWWQKQAANLQHNVLTTVQSGLVQGKSTQDIAAELQDMMGEDSVTLAQAKALARTAAATVQSAAQAAYYDQNDDIIKGIRWVSTLDDRTTPECMALDGLSWKMSQDGEPAEPLGHDIDWPGYPPIHWNCRSTTVPVLKSWQELSKIELPHLDDQTVNDIFKAKLAEQGFDEEAVAAIEANQRASMDGAVPEGLTYEDWLRKQSELIQKQILGPARWQLWQDGKVSLMDMIKKDTLEPLTVDELMAAAAQNKAVPPPPPPPDGYQGLSLAERQILTAQMTAEATSGETYATWLNPANGVTVDQTLKYSLNKEEQAQLAGQENLVHLSNTASNGRLWGPSDAALWAGQPGFQTAKLVTPSGRVITAKLKSGKVWTEADAKKFELKLEEAKDEGISDPFAQLRYAFRETGDKMILTQTEPGALKLDSSTMKKVYGPVHEEDKPLSYLEAHTNQLELAKQADLSAAQADIQQQMKVADSAAQKAAEESQLARQKQAALQQKVAEQRLAAAEAAQKEAAAIVAKQEAELAAAKAAAERQAATEANALRAHELALQELAAIQQEQKEAEELAAKIEKKKKASEAAKKAAATKAKNKALAAEIKKAQAVDAQEALLAEQAAAKVAARAQQMAQDALWAAEQDKANADKIKAATEAEEAAAKAQADAIKAQKAQAKKKAAAPVNTTGQMELTLEPKAVAKDSFPADPMQLKVVQKLGGSTGAELVEDADGNKYVRKMDTNKGQVNDEFLADQIYTKAGINTPEGKLYSTPQGPVKLTKYIDGGKMLSDYLAGASAVEKARVMAQIADGFVADAWLANWDVAGLSLDNILVDRNGKAWRIDNGGSLRYRGMGSRKTEAQFGDKVVELDTLRDSRTAPQAAQLFKHVSPQQIVDQSVKLYQQKDSLLAMFPPELRAKMAARLDDIDQYATELVAQGKAKMPPMGLPVVEAPPEVPKPKVTMTVKGFPADPMALKVVEDYPVGSGKGEIVEDAAGNKYLRRTGGDSEAMREESRAADFLSHFGVLVPDHEMFEVAGKPVMLQKFVGGQSIDQFLQAATDADKKKLALALGQNFHLDALMGNTHVADGIRITRDKTGKLQVWRVDNSGVFWHNETGGPKQLGAWDGGQGVAELWTMRGKEAPHAVVQPSGHSVAMFQHLDIVDVAAKLRSLPPEPPTTGDAATDVVLRKRWENMRQIAEGVLDADHFDMKTDFLEAQSAQRGNLKQMGVTDRISGVTLKQTGGAGSYEMADQNGKLWDDLRTVSGTRAQPIAAAGSLPQDSYYNPIVTAVKNVNSKLGTGAPPNWAKVDAAIAQKSHLEYLAANGTVNEQHMASKYLQVIQELEQVKAAGVAKQIAPFQQYVMPSARQVAQVPTSSISAQIRAEIERQVGPNGYKLIQYWAQSQAGSSQSPESKAMRVLWKKIRDVPTDRRYMGGADQRHLNNFLRDIGLGETEATKAIQIWNGFMQELFANMDLPNNDRELRVLKLLRKEPRDVQVLLPSGMKEYLTNVSAADDAKVIKGAFDSHSLVQWVHVHGRTYTTTAMPHSLINGFYGLEHSPGTSFFAGDHENELAADGAMVPVKTHVSAATPPTGQDATQWSLDLSHLRPDDGSLD